MIAAVILAAGASSRMGSPKALLPYGGETFVTRLIRVFSKECAPVIVVTGYHADAIRLHVETFSPAAVVVRNPIPERGQLSSLQTALHKLPEDAQGFLFAPVDCPSPAEETVAKITAAFRTRASDTQLVVPSYQEHHGHPVCASREIAEKLLALAPTATAREVIHGHRAQTRYVAVNDPGILIDVDDPAAYRKLTQPMERTT